MYELANRIYLFLGEYADINHNSEPDDIIEYTSPDASILKCCADLLAENIIPDDINSSWESCGYSPYNSLVGRIEHDSIINELIKLKNK